ncbi:histidine kinase [Actinomadura nitritigenes]|uniref:histidine kinase n=1 Tax=Actinomadura nitritigenes TaxID=134602 RepID=UPI003D8A907C
MMIEEHAARARTAATALARWWRARPTATRDTELALVFTLLSFAAPLSQIAARFGDLPPRDASAASVLLTLGQTLPTAVRTRWPAVCLAVVGTSFAVHECLGYPPTFGSLGLYIALYSAGAHQARFRPALAAAVTVGYAVFAVTLYALDSPERPSDYLLYYLVLATAFGLGVLVRRRRAREAERRRLSAEAAIAAERSRLARELHDVVTHHVTAMVVQSGAAQYLTESRGLRDASGGRGLTGLRERVETLGGEFTAGPDPDGGFRVRARIPTGGTP